jgi:hypothetical protein
MTNGCCTGTGFAATSWPLEDDPDADEPVFVDAPDELELEPELELELELLEELEDVLAVAVTVPGSGANGSRTGPPRCLEAPLVVSATARFGLGVAATAAMPGAPALMGGKLVAGAGADPDPPVSAYTRPATSAARSTISTTRTRRSSRSARTELKKAFMA